MASFPVPSRRSTIHLSAVGMSANSSSTESAESGGAADPSSQAIQDAIAVFELVRGATLLKAVKNVSRC